MYITDIDWRSQNLRHLYPGMGLQLGYLGFCLDQNNRDSSGVYVRMYYCLSIKINTPEMPHGVGRLWMHFVCVCSCVCGRQRPNTPNWSSMTGDAITRAV